MAAYKDEANVKRQNTDTPQPVQPTENTVVSKTPETSTPAQNQTTQATSPAAPTRSAKDILSAASPVAPVQSGARVSVKQSTKSSAVPDLTPYLDEWRSLAEQQVSNATDYAVEQGVNELTRAQEDAQKQFDTQRNQVSINEAKALDNQALYAEARGDKGGIGAAQYGIIQANAAKNRLAVSQAQTELATETARQIADLRAQGEFEKADAVLQIGQSYLSQLMNLKQWSAEFAFEQEQYQQQLKQWRLNFAYDIAKTVGSFVTGSLPGILQGISAIGGDIAGSGSVGGGGVVSYGNDGLSSDVIKEMQRALGLTGDDVDGMWGAKTAELAGGFSALDYYKAYQKAKAIDIDSIWARNGI